jgi:hypothetical protein
MYPPHQQSQQHQSQQHQSQQLQNQQHQSQQLQNQLLLLHPHLLSTPRANRPPPKSLRSLPSSAPTLTRTPTVSNSRSFHQQTVDGIGVAFGDCDGPRQLDGKIPKVPCACPPTRADFLKHLTADVNAGHAVNNPTVRSSQPTSPLTRLTPSQVKVNFPTDNSVRSKLDRITASIITLQNLNGPGKGCPGVSTTLGVRFFFGDILNESAY